MTRQELIEAILKTYDEDMIRRFEAYLRRQPKSELEKILKNRLSK